MGGEAAGCTLSLLQEDATYKHSENTACCQSLRQAAGTAGCSLSLLQEGIPGLSAATGAATNAATTATDATVSAANTAVDATVKAADTATHAALNAIQKDN